MTFPRYDFSTKCSQTFFRIPILESSMASGIRIHVRKMSVFYSICINLNKERPITIISTSVPMFSGSVCSTVCVPTSHYAPIHRKMTRKPEVLYSETNRDINTMPVPTPMFSGSPSSVNISATLCELITNRKWKWTSPDRK